MSDKRIRTLIDAREYRERLEARSPERDPAVLAWRGFQRCVLAILLGASSVIFYSISVDVEILSLPKLGVSVPAKAVAFARSPRGATP